MQSVRRVNACDSHVLQQHKIYRAGEGSGGAGGNPPPQQVADALIWIQTPQETIRTSKITILCKDVDFLPGGPRCSAVTLRNRFHMLRRH